MNDLLTLKTAIIIEGKNGIKIWLTDDRLIKKLLNKFNPLEVCFLNRNVQNYLQSLFKKLIIRRENGSNEISIIKREGNKERLIGCIQCLSGKYSKKTIFDKEFFKEFFNNVYDVKII